MALPKGMNKRNGRIVDKMTRLLLCAGEVPISVARFMQARLQDGEEFPSLWGYGHTSDLGIYPQGENRYIYVLLTVDNQGRFTSNGLKALELIDCDNLASNNGAIVGQLEELKGDNLIEISRKWDNKKLLNERFWRVIARDPDEVPPKFAEDKGLLRRYYCAVNSKIHDPNEFMNPYVEDSLKDKTTIKVWCLDGVGFFGGRSNADCTGSLRDMNGHLIGLASEALVARDKTP